MMSDSEQVKRIKEAIMKGKRRGMCDGEGRSVKNGFGQYVAQPRVIPRRLRK